jgi:hypothetical protein
MSEIEKQAVETPESPIVDVNPEDRGDLVATTDFGRELLAIRNKAIAEGMKLCSVEEILAELAADRANCRNFKFKRIFFLGDLEYPAFELFFLLRINAESFFSKKR